MKTRALAALPLLVATALFAYVSRSVAPALVVALGVAVAVPLAARLDASRRVQRAVLVAVGLLAVVVAAPAVLPLGAPAPTGPAGVWGIVIVTALLLTLARRFFRDAEGDSRWMSRSWRPWSQGAARGVSVPSTSSQWFSSPRPSSR